MYNRPDTGFISLNIITDSKIFFTKPKPVGNKKYIRPDVANKDISKTMLCIMYYLLQMGFYIQTYVSAMLAFYCFALIKFTALIDFALINHSAKTCF